VEGMDPEQMFLAFRDAYVGAMKAKEIAEADARQEMHHLHVEMDEMRAWDEYALAALEHNGAETPLACAQFADELLKHRRATFLVGDDK
jgi:hypothetical protein